MGHLTDFASLYGMPGPSESVSSLSCNFLTGVVWGVVAGVVLPVALLMLLLFAESFLAWAMDGCGSSGHAVWALVWLLAASLVAVDCMSVVLVCQ